MISLQPVSYDVYISKYQLKNVDKDIDDTYRRVAKALSNSEVDKDYWSDKFIGLCIMEPHQVDEYYLMLVLKNINQILV